MNHFFLFLSFLTLGFSSYGQILCSSKEACQQVEAKAFKATGEKPKTLVSCSFGKGSYSLKMKTSGIDDLIVSIQQKTSQMTSEYTVETQTHQIFKSQTHDPLDLHNLIKFYGDAVKNGHASYQLTIESLSLSLKATSKKRSLLNTVLMSTWIRLTNIHHEIGDVFDTLFDRDQDNIKRAGSITFNYKVQSFLAAYMDENLEGTLTFDGKKYQITCEDNLFHTLR